MNEYVLGGLLIAMFSFGVFSGVITTSRSVMENTIEDYHCQPITTHSTIEEAKEKVREYQEDGL